MHNTARTVLVAMERVAQTEEFINTSTLHSPVSCYRCASAAEGFVCKATALGVDDDEGKPKHRETWTKSAHTIGLVHCCSLDLDCLDSSFRSIMP